MELEKIYTKWKEVEGCLNNGSVGKYWVKKFLGDLDNIKVNVKQLMFVISDTHGLVNEMWEYILKNGYEPDNENHLLILNGDMIDKTDDVETLMSDLTDLRKYISGCKNVIYILGNQEIAVIDKLAGDNIEFLKKQNMVFKNDDFIIVHGWFNPRWSVKEHFEKNFFDGEQTIFGDLVNGSPVHINTYQNKGLEYFGYTKISDYFSELEKISQTLIVGHTWSFLFDVEKCFGWDYKRLMEEVNNINTDGSILKRVFENYDFDKEFVSKNKKLICSDICTKKWRFGFEKQFKLLSFYTNFNNIELFDINGNAYFFRSEDGK